MKVYLAHIRTKHADVYFAAATEVGIRGKVANWCRQFWTDAGIDGDAAELTDLEVIDTYFDPENMGSHEWVNFDDDEVTDG